MTDASPSGAPIRTSPMTGHLDGYDTDIRTALAKLDRERRSSFARPGQRAEALDRFYTAARFAAEKVLGAHRAELAALKVNLKADRKTVTGLRTDLAAAGEQNSALSRQLADLEDELTSTQAAAQEIRDDLFRAEEKCRVLTGHVTDLEAEVARSQVWADRVAVLDAELEQARHTITELQGQAATHQCEPLPQRVRPDATPEVTTDPAIPLDGPRIVTDATDTAVRSSGKSTNAPRRTGRPGGAK